MELVTTAMNQMTLFSWWWLAVPVAVGIILIVIGVVRDIVELQGVGIFTTLVVTGLLAVANITPGSYNEDLMRADVAEQLQIEETVKDGQWYLGKGPDGEFVRFTLVEKDGTEDTYIVVMEK